ncbi:D-alanyl-D-alanine carboxypeptidase family protein [Treponema medium]|nr:D-alanyl-D-alanine carboxypeptidase family protein [Treponema medium]
MKKILCIMICLLSFFCVTAVDANMETQLRSFAYPSAIPVEMQRHISNNAVSFLADLQKILAVEKENLLILVDKQHLLPDGYTPQNLVRLDTGRAYIINRKDLSLTKTAEQALQEMALAAKRDGVTLIVSSSYRSYTYQKNLFDRYVRESGEKEAERFSARAGTSQHQLGTVVDFGSISDEFAQTRAGKWVLQNASKYGWSLSFPKGYEAVTGYVWESWHYRYIGVEACDFQQKWFGDIQQYMLEFIDAWKKQTR